MATAGRPASKASRKPAAKASRATGGHTPVAAAESELTRDERAAAGKEARKQVPRSSHAAWEPAAGRPDPVELLEEQAVTRVPELVPIRYGRMSVSPFTFFRGAALLMASDLAHTPDSGLKVQACGDAHLSNFGGFASPERELIFDLNDFDETLPGPWEWDVKRLDGERRGRGARAGLQGGRAPRSAARLRAPLSPGDRQIRRHGQPRGLVLDAQPRRSSRRRCRG